MKEAHKGANKERKAHKRSKKKCYQTNMLSSKRGCPRMTNVSLDLVSIVPLYWSMEETCAIKRNS